MYDSGVSRAGLLHGVPGCGGEAVESEICMAHVEVRSFAEGVVVIDCSLLSGGGSGEDGEVAMRMEGVHCRIVRVALTSFSNPFMTAFEAWHGYRPD